MNKYILAILIVLLAVQGLDAQFISGLISFFTSVVGFVFNAVLTVPSSIISFAATFTVVVSNATLASLSFLNSGAHNALIRVNNFTNDLNNLTNYYNSLIHSRSNTGTFLGRTIVGNLYDAINGIGYTTSGLSAIVVGCRPSQPPPISFLGTYYPLPDSCLSTTNCTNTTIGCAARNFVNLARYQISNIDAASSYIRWLYEDFGNNGTTNVTVNAQVIIDYWTGLSAAANLYVSVNSQGTLLAYINGSFNTNFTEVMSLTSDFLHSLNDATSYLINSTSIMSFRIHDHNSSERYVNWTQIFQSRSRRWSLINSLIAYNTFRSNINNVLISVNGSIYQFAQYINGITTSYVYPTVQAHSTSFQNLVNQVNTSLSRFLTNFNATINSVEQSKKNLILNATAALNGSFNALITSILNENLENCTHFTASAADALADFSLGLQACGQNADISTQSYYVNATGIFNSLLTNVSAYMNTSNSCFSYACNGNALYPVASYGVQCTNDNSFFRCNSWLPPFFYYCQTSKSTYLNTCLGNLNTAINSFITNVDPAINTTLSSLSSSINSALTSLNTCINNQVNTTDNALDGIFAAYNNCKASQVV
ncbi:uncharacterized protein [Chironomus tepperi]|uniref:uncharacterized protein n=1 Tax=Chironomus tepperi TaxID=113505 RepID=UPI00391EEFAD